ncbi:MAG: 3'(2'),5'-bisphosphate nucleotidase CysQ [Gemmataceae bacterium]
MDFTKELAAARDAAATASKIIFDIGEKLTADRHAPADISTEADRASQDAILRRLSEEFPGDAFRAEEKTEALAGLPQKADRMWIIDPIDGTRGFVMKNGEYSVMIALVVGGELAVGVVAEPSHDRQVYATRGGGCWRQEGQLRPRRVRVTTIPHLENAKLIQSHAKPGTPPSKEVAAIHPMHVIETYSAGVKLARVADGSADLYVCDYATLQDWDLAAGHILVEEAGGRVTTFKGASLRYGDVSPTHIGGLIATNGHLHDLAISALAVL